MQFTNILSLVACLAFTSALPAPSNFYDVTFHGAASAEYTIKVLADGRTINTGNALSISSISSSLDVEKYCTLRTVDYPPTLVEGPSGTWQVGPPQTVLSIACNKPVEPPSPVTVDIEFNGAADAKYSLNVPLDGTVVPTNNELSISTIFTTFAGLPNCNIKYVDFPAALVLISANIWAVGPPQTVLSIQCFA
ncbi:hypothetical protein BJ878DRAFT_210935 [Calycina marina]|uniref:Uncharacterized protein n=1 Tax=Calycina marina TaxID=1763456 RepID=A0A9P7YY25_9HELO|nr:hypothetical protein BJ878DRAFT_210935 [Calycina marina]